MTHFTHYKHELLSKYINVFGTIFNDIEVRRTTKAGVELERMKVPVSFGPKEKYMSRLRNDPDFGKQVQITLPRISFDLVSMDYDPQSKTNSLLRMPKPNTASMSDAVFNGVPYILQFNLSIFARTLSDGFEIVEQILPLFAPDYTLKSVPLNSMGFVKDIPVMLNQVQPNIQYEGDFEELRVVTFDFSFSMRVYFFGPISPVKVIKKVYANTFIDPSLEAGYIVRANMGAGSGTYKLDELVYQGHSPSRANAYGVVIKWDANNSYLKIGAPQGQFKTGENVYSTTTNANYSLTSFEVNPLKVVSIETTADPNTAEPGEPFDYVQTITEYPNLDD